MALRLSEWLGLAMRHLRNEGFLSRSALGEVVRNKRICMAMSQSMLGLEECNQFHVLPVAGSLEQAEPVLYGMPVLLFY